MLAFAMAVGAEAAGALATRDKTCAPAFAPGLLPGQGPSGGRQEGGAGISAPVFQADVSAAAALPGQCVVDRPKPAGSPANMLVIAAFSSGIKPSMCT